MDIWKRFVSLYGINNIKFVWIQKIEKNVKVALG